MLDTQSYLIRCNRLDKRSTLLYRMSDVEYSSAIGQNLDFEECFGASAREDTARPAFARTYTSYS